MKLWIQEFEIFTNSEKISFVLGQIGHFYDFTRLISI